LLPSDRNHDPVPARQGFVAFGGTELNLKTAEEARESRKSRRMGRASNTGKRPVFSGAVFSIFLKIFGFLRIVRGQNPDPG